MNQIFKIQENITLFGKVIIHSSQEKRERERGKENKHFPTINKN